MMAHQVSRAMKSWSIGLLLSVAVIITIIVVVIRLKNDSITVTASIQAISTNTPSPHDLWTSKNISSYQMRLVTEAEPQPPVGLDLTIQGSKIVKVSIVACDNPSKEYPASDCDTIHHYYPGVGRYTVDQLFEFADICTQQTRTSVAICPAFATGDFHGFSTSDELFNAAQNCKGYLHSSNPLCAVQYDPDYGYPKLIFSYSPEVMDGGGVITVEGFHDLSASSHRR